MRKNNTKEWSIHLGYSILKNLKMMQTKESNEPFEMVSVPGKILMKPTLYPIKKEYDYNCFAILPLHLTYKVLSIERFSKSEQEEIKDVISRHLIPLN